MLILFHFHISLSISFEHANLIYCCVNYWSGCRDIVTFLWMEVTNITEINETNLKIEMKQKIRTKNVEEASTFFSGCQIKDFSFQPIANQRSIG